MIGLLRDSGNRRQCQFGRAEQQISVAALEGGFFAHLQAGPSKRLTRGSGREILQPVGQRSRMRATADALTMRVEQDHLDTGYPMVLQRLPDLQPQPLDQVAGCQLSDITAGIGVTKLQRQFPGLLQVITVMRAAQRFFQHGGALLQRLRLLEQRRDLDVLLDAEQPGQP
jgi:hypothetical protein